MNKYFKQILTQFRIEAKFTNLSGIMRNATKSNKKLKSMKKTQNKQGLKKIKTKFYS